MPMEKLQRPTFHLKRQLKRFFSRLTFFRLKGTLEWVITQRKFVRLPPKVDNKRLRIKNVFNFLNSVFADPNSRSEKYDMRIFPSCFIFICRGFTLIKWGQVQSILKVVVIDGINGLFDLLRLSPVCWKLWNFKALMTCVIREIQEKKSESPTTRARLRACQAFELLYYTKNLNTA